MSRSRPWRRPDGRIERLIARRHGPADLERSPRVAAEEFSLLQLLKSAGLAAPTPRYLDAAGEIFSTPCLVVDYVEGEPGPAAGDETDTVTQLAPVLAQIHCVDCSTADVSFLPDRVLIPADARRPDESADERSIRDFLESAAPPPQRNRSVLLHGDFWPGNTLWQDGRLVAVIDWEVASHTGSVKRSRLGSARRRATLAKAALGAGGSVVFAAGMLLARASDAGHPKWPVHPLAAPPHFVAVVRANLLQAGIVAPAQAPSDAATSVS